MQSLVGLLRLRTFFNLFRRNTKHNPVSHNTVAPALTDINSAFNQDLATFRHVLGYNLGLFAKYGYGKECRAVLAVTHAHPKRGIGDIAILRCFAFRIAGSVAD